MREPDGRFKHLDLFSGIGGFALAAKWCEIETVAFCEIDQYCQKVLNKNFPGIKIHEEIKELNGNDYKGIDIITGGYPCQPFSVAGSQKATKDDRHLWPEMFRIIAQARPTWIICENVYGHVALGLDKVLHDLEGESYAARTFIIPALATGANHNRERVFIVAYSTGDGQHRGQVRRGDDQANERSKKGAQQDRDNEGFVSLRYKMDRQSEKARIGRTEPPALRVANELPNRMDRNRMLGNSIDPKIAYQIFKCIKNN